MFDYVWDPDSAFEWLKQLPQVYVVAYQGSEASTSEGIYKVFQKAQSYWEANKKENIIPNKILMILMQDI